MGETDFFDLSTPEGNEKWLRYTYGPYLFADMGPVEWQLFIDKTLKEKEAWDKAVKPSPKAKARTDQKVKRADRIPGSSGTNKIFF